MLLVEHANHLLFFNNEYSGGHDRGSRPDSNILACQATQCAAHGEAEGYLATHQN
jgi:hypothetical protein